MDRLKTAYLALVVGLGGPLERIRPCSVPALCNEPAIGLVVANVKTIQRIG